MKINHTTTESKRVTESTSRELQIAFLEPAGKPEWREACDRILTRVFESTSIDPAALLRVLEKHGAKRFVVAPTATKKPVGQLTDDKLIALYVSTGAEPTEAVEEALALLAGCVGKIERRKRLDVLESWEINHATADKCTEAADIPFIAEATARYAERGEDVDSYHKPSHAVREYNAAVAAAKRG